MPSKTEQQKNASFVSVRAFIAALVIIGALMILCYIATLLLPCAGIPFWQWLLSPVLVLGGSDKVTLLGVIFFLLIIGGVFNALTQYGVMQYMVEVIVQRFGARRYRLMAVVMLFFMAMGSLIGSFEEVVPMVPVVSALAVSLGWDALTGLSMSLLAAGCGFAAGVFNPFTVGIAQELAGLPMFSGAWFRAIGFVLIYALLYFTTRSHARSVDTGLASAGPRSFVRDAKKSRGVMLFAVIVGMGIALVMSSALLTALRDYTFIIVGLMFLLAGLVSCLVSGMSGAALGKAFLNGLVSMLPGVLMILMASSIKYTLQTAGALDSILAATVTAAGILPRRTVILFIYLIVLTMNFFIPSGSAKAIMLTPLLVPVAESFGIPAQLVVVAYAFGDGFSNAFYPTNPVLLVSLSLTGTDYSAWFRYSGKFQLANLLLTSLMLLLGLAIGLS